MLQPKTAQPAPPPQPAQPGPAAVVHAPRKPRSWGGWIALLLVAAVIAGGLWYRQGNAQKAATAALAGVRTHTVAAGTLVRTLRLTGTTGAERYSSLLAPRLSGSRSDFGRGGGSFGRGDSRRGSTDSVSSRTGTGSSSQSAASLAGADSGGSGQGGIQSSRAATGVQSMTSRTSSRSTSRNATTARTSGSTAASAALGADGLGSTASGLSGGSGGPPSIGSSGGGGSRGGSGGGRGGGEFSMVLLAAPPPGSLVKKGDMVAEFDRQYMLTRLDDYKAGVAQTESAFKKLQAELELGKKAHTQTIEVAKANYEKAKLDMRTLPVRSAMDSERFRLALEEAEAQLKQIQQEVKHVDVGIVADRKVAELQVRQSQLELQRNERNVERMILRAPIDGLVVMQNTFRGAEFDQIKVGDQVYAGMNFMQIVDTSSMVINATVSQADVELIRIGYKAKVRFDAFPGLELPARISAIGTVASGSRYRPDWVRDVPVVLKLDAMDRRVIPDLSVSCDVILESVEAPAVLPRESIFTETRAAAVADGTPAAPVHYVWVRDQKGAWTRRDVEVGIANFVHAAVRSGLKPGEVVALEPPARPAGSDKG